MFRVYLMHNVIYSIYSISVEYPCLLFLNAQDRIFNIYYITFVLNIHDICLFDAQDNIFNIYCIEFQLNIHVNCLVDT